MAGMLRWNTAKARHPLRFHDESGPVLGTLNDTVSRSMHNGIYGAVDSTTPPTTPTATVLRNVRALRSSSDYEVLRRGDESVSMKPSTLTLTDTIEAVDNVMKASSPSRSCTSISISKAASNVRRKSVIVRDKWANKLEFLLAVVGYAVDLGNIWRFPTVCYKHGGGAFLIPWIVCLFLGGLPMFYMELALGQFHKSGCISIWRKICPLFKGIGYGICFICTFIACFYNAIIARAVYFMFASIAWEVPWKRCNNDWNTLDCAEELNSSLIENGTFRKSPSEEYFKNKVLESRSSTGFDDLGGIKSSMAFCLFLVFVAVYFALWKGPKSSGKMVWVTATAPYVVLTILLIRGVTLPGASIGISYYLTPNFEKLKDPEVWSAAASQIFFSLGPGFGVLLALSSYNEFNNNCYRDALVTSFINCATSFFSGFVIFSTLGYMSVLTNKKVSEVVEGADDSLIFIVYPQAIATMSYSPVWAVIFFAMLITLGIDSTFSGIEALITGFCDEYPRLLLKRRELFVFIVISIFYVGSLPGITYGGMYVIPFLDEYGVSLSVLFICMCEMVAVCWFYGVARFSEDIRSMLGFYPGIYWRFTWTFAPLMIATLFGVTVYNASFKPFVVGDYVYPIWSVYFGWFLRLLSIMSIPSYILYLFANTKGTFTERIRLMVRPLTRDNSVYSCIQADNPHTHVFDSSCINELQHLSQV